MFTYDPHTHKVLLTTYTDKNGPKELILIFETELTGDRLKEAIKDATRMYLMTESGKAVLQQNNNVFNYGDFVDHVPPDMQACFDIKLAAAIPTDADADHNENLADGLDVETIELAQALASQFSRNTTRPVHMDITGMTADQLADWLNSLDRQPLRDDIYGWVMDMASFIEYVDSKCFIDYDGYGELVFDDMLVSNSTTQLSAKVLIIQQKIVPLHGLYDKLGCRVKIVWHNR